MRIVKAFFMCFGMFTSIPCPYRPWDDDARPMMTACLPLVGAVLGAVWYVLSALGRAILPGGLAAALMASLPFLLTGFMHLDGFMDTADAVLSWRPLEQRQKILKDVHCGSFSVVALALLMMGMYAASGDAMEGSLRPLMLIPAASRCLSAFCVSTLTPIGHSEYSSMPKNTGTSAASLIMLAVTLLLAGAAAGAAGFIAVLAVIVGYGCAMLWTVRMLHGVSGDLAGFSLCVGELCGLIALAVL